MSTSFYSMCTCIQNPSHSPLHHYGIDNTLTACGKTHCRYMYTEDYLVHAHVYIQQYAYYIQGTDLALSYDVHTTIVSCSQHIYMQHRPRVDQDTHTCNNMPIVFQTSHWSGSYVIHIYPVTALSYTAHVKPQEWKPIYGDTSSSNQTHIISRARDRQTDTPNRRPSWA